jgi:hypothetical protein
MIQRTLLLALILWPTIAAADLTLTGHSTMGGFGTSLAQEDRLLIQDTWLRRDFMDRGKAYTHMYDLAKRQVVIIDHSFRSAEIYDMAALNGATQVSAPAEKLDMNVTRTDHKRALGDWTCFEHAVSASMPALLGTEPVTFVLNGTVWLASGVPEQAAVKALVRASKDPDFFVGIPTAVKIAPTQARGISEIVRRLAPKGLMCGGEVAFTFEGNGPMANLARKMPAKLGIQYQAYSDDPISKEAFAIPAGYRVVKQ